MIHIAPVLSTIGEKLVSTFNCSSLYCPVCYVNCGHFSRCLLLNEDTEYVNAKVRIMERDLKVRANIEGRCSVLLVVTSCAL